MYYSPDGYDGSVSSWFNAVGIPYLYQMNTRKNHQKIFLFMVAAAMLFSAGFAAAVEKPLQGEAMLLDTYHRVMPSLETSNFGLPLFLESFEPVSYTHLTLPTNREV